MLLIPQRRGCNPLMLAVGMVLMLTASNASCDAARKGDAGGCCAQGVDADPLRRQASAPEPENELKGVAVPDSRSAISAADPASRESMQRRTTDRRNGSSKDFVVGGIVFGSGLAQAHLETATMAQTLVTGNGQDATAYGQVLAVNGVGNYCGGGGRCALYYVASFKNSKQVANHGVEFTGATISLYYADAAANLLSRNSTANLATIRSMTPWLTLVGHGNLGGGVSNSTVLTAFSSLSGAVVNRLGAGLFDVDLAGPGMSSVKFAFNSNVIPDAVGGFADVQLTFSSSGYALNANDTAGGLSAGCRNGTAAAGAWCYQGTADFRGSLQEPSESGSSSMRSLGRAPRTPTCFEGP
ncbi:hypothetical protein J2X20_004085 [Pelomonas saccharophila]|uniref:Uncharacterized protein n=1 Tax=Roseateles saccharophilus TaxID=304 RepID=A0ABU1YRC6_ROSSA|nr:hypothetical protein [Roseateles saccharophilus]MDR7271417.1 hypothetical protein [Roseateles saccharophilus]